MYALTGMAARAHQATTSAAAALASDRDIYAAGFGTRGHSRTFGCIVMICMH